jgi:CDP-2,3-bis-(O-geranylgeranyl)-sn-glycerol synthase
LILLAVANGTPVIAKKILGDRLARPLDGGTLFYDGKPVFGPTKTIRGIVASLLVTPFAAWLMGLQWELGVVIAAAAMAGDLCSSFVKRRMTLPSAAWPMGSIIFRSLLPWRSRLLLPLSPSRRLAGVAIFCVGALLLSHPVPFQLARPALLIGVR